jgi:hypothetical protein
MVAVVTYFFPKILHSCFTNNIKKNGLDLKKLHMSIGFELGIFFQANLISKAAIKKQHS